LLSTAAKVAMRDNRNLLELVGRLQADLDIARRRLAWIQFAATGEGYAMTFHGQQYVPVVAITNALGLTDDVRYVTIREAAA